MSRVPRNLDLTGLETLEQKPKDKTPEIKRQGPEQQAQEQRTDQKKESKQEQRQEQKQEHKKERKHRHKKSGHRKHHSSGDHQHRQKKQDAQQPKTQQPVIAPFVGNPKHMTTQFTQMMERQRQQSQQDVSPTLQQRVDQSQQQEAPQQRQESTRPSRGKVGGLTSMFEAKIKQMEQEAQSQRKPTSKQDDEAPKQRTGRGNKR